MENTYKEIREICGSPSLKLMVDKILTKETNYNESLAKINELQNQIEVYDKDIAELEIKLKIKQFFRKKMKKQFQHFLLI